WPFAAPSSAKRGRSSGTTRARIPGAVAADRIGVPAPGGGYPLPGGDRGARQGVLLSGQTFFRENASVGSIFISFTVLSGQDPLEAFTRRQVADCYEYGHAPSSGTFGAIDRLSVRP